MPSKFSTFCSALALLGLSIAVPGSAQDGSEGTTQRSPESANRFLAVAFSQADAEVSYEVMVRDEAIVADDAAGGEPRPVLGALAAISPAGNCRSRIVWRNAEVANGKHWPLGEFARTIDWSRVAKVAKTVITKTTHTYDQNNKPAGDKVRTMYGLRLTMRNDWQQSISFATTSEEERDRAAFAVDFLRNGCDAAADTGF